MAVRLQPGARLVVASHNAGKIREIAELLAPYAVQAISAADLSLPEPEETGATFAENAAIKARAAAEGANLPALADDSGLEVAALDGAPGVFSARWAGPGRDFEAAMSRVEKELAAKGADSPAKRRANFACALTLAWPSGATAAFEGKIHGTLVWPPRGSQGFGYDPMFLPDGFGLTFGEMAPAAKHAVSHRARAFAHFVRAMLTENSE